MTSTSVGYTILDEKTGALSKAPASVARAGAKGERIKYSERLLESLIVLNPFLVGAEGHVPLVAHGGQSVADLVYRDDIGRLLAIECKSGVATCENLAQLLGYGYQLPFEPERAAYEELLGVDVAMLRTGDDALHAACKKVFNSDSRASIEAAKNAVDKALGKGPLVHELTAAVRKRLGLTKLTPCSPEARFATSARMVLVAPGFDEDCIAICEQLSRRTVDVSLIQVKMFDGPEGRVVERQVVHEPASMHAVRNAIGHIWRSEQGRSLLSRLGWVFSEETPSFKFAGRWKHNVTIELLSGDACVVAVRIPHSTFEKAVTDRMKAKLSAALPDGFSKDGSDWVWEGDWSAEEWARKAVEVADAAREALSGM